MVCQHVLILFYYVFPIYIIDYVPRFLELDHIYKEKIDNIKNEKKDGVITISPFD